MRDIKQLHPELQKKIELLKAACDKYGHKIGIGECLRTVAEQDALYAQGRTKPGKVVTNARGATYSSQHQWGVAVDFFQNIKGHEYDDLSFFNAVGALAKQLGLGWGGDWKSPVDRPHLYLKDWGSTTTQLKARYGTPDKFFATWGSSGTSSTAPAPSPKTPLLFNIYSALGAKVDGTDALAKSVTVSKSYNKKHAVVKPLQEYLNAKGFNCGKVDGVFGANTEKAVLAFQSGFLKKPDGILSAKGTSWKKILTA